MSDFVRVLAVDSLPPGQATEVTVNGESVALFNVGGVFHALSNRCPHRGGPLGQGFVDGAEVSCPWHNWTFDVTTGENTTDSAMRVSRHAVKIQDAHVFVRLGGSS
jgi:nitrite reductase (NADH) small subunit/3-phenylpropionate/trans-cinnamate dioxygenase ferredoxin subunit